MATHCFSTSSYVLSMRWRTTDPNLKLSKVGMVYYNNLLAVLTVWVAKALPAAGLPRGDEDVVRIEHLRRLLQGNGRRVLVRE